jgi:radical SAM protein with 4Fe4S-binding SPASM domain
MQQVSKSDNRKPKTYVQLIQMKQNMDEADAFKKYWSNYDVNINIINYQQWGSKLEYIIDNDIQKKKCEPNQRKACSDLWNKMVFDCNGNVVLCGYDFQRNNLLGNIMDKSIREIWHGAVLNNVRKKHINKEYSSISICSNCKDWTIIPPRYNEIETVEKMILGKPA